MRASFLACLLLAPALAAAEERYDHRGALGLTVATGGEYVTAIAIAGRGGETGGRIPIELGGTLALRDGLELRLAGRFSPGVPPLTAPAGAVFAGVRSSFGYAQWKTFFDLELAAHVAPFLAFGARAAFGVQYDFLPIMGVYAQLGGQLGGAAALRISFEGVVGLQFRTYLFE